MTIVLFIYFIINAFASGYVLNEDTFGGEIERSTVFKCLLVLLLGIPYYIGFVIIEKVKDKKWFKWAASIADVVQLYFVYVILHRWNNITDLQIEWLKERLTHEKRRMQILAINKIIKLNTIKRNKCQTR